jgi:hypothetical protein
MKFETRILSAVAILICLATVLSTLVAAQEGKRQAMQPPGSVFSRILSTNYAQPVIQGFGGRSDATLDSMIKDGKLELSQEDAIRLALENNVDKIGRAHV